MTRMAWRGIGCGMMLALLVCAAPPPAPTAGAVPAAKPPLTALGAVLPGLWRLRMLDASAGPQRDLCVADPHALMQLRHAGAICESLVVVNEAKITTIQYSCPGSGWGRTSLHLESPTLVQIDTQGIADNAPFAFVAEARRTGDCAPPPPPVAAK